MHLISCHIALFCSSNAIDVNSKRTQSTKFSSSIFFSCSICIYFLKIWYRSSETNCFSFHLGQFLYCFLVVVNRLNLSSFLVVGIHIYLYIYIVGEKLIIDYTVSLLYQCLLVLLISVWFFKWRKRNTTEMRNRLYRCKNLKAEPEHIVHKQILFSQ